MLISSEALIKEFHSTIKQEFPDITIEELTLICYSPWKFLKEEMGSGKMTKVRLKYLGTFQVYPKRVAYILSQLDERLRNGKITKKYYDTIKKILEEYLKNNPIIQEEDD